MKLARFMFALLVLVLVLSAPTFVSAQDNGNGDNDKDKHCPKVKLEWGDQKIATGGLGEIRAARNVDTVTITQPDPGTTDPTTRDAHHDCEGMCIELFDYSTPPGGDILKNDVPFLGSKGPFAGGTEVYPKGTQQFAHWKVIIVTGCAHVSKRQIFQNTGTREIRDKNGKTIDSCSLQCNLPDGTPNLPNGTPDPFNSSVNQDPNAHGGWQLDGNPGAHSGASVPANAGPGAGLFVDAPGHINNAPWTKTGQDLRAWIAAVGQLGETVEYKIHQRYVTYIYCDTRLIALAVWGFDEDIIIDGNGIKDTITAAPGEPYVLCVDPPDATIRYYSALIKELDPTAR